MAVAAVAVAGIAPLTTLNSIAPPVPPTLLPSSAASPRMVAAYSLSSGSSSAAARGSRKSGLTALRRAHSPLSCQRATSCASYWNEGTNTTTPWGTVCATRSRASPSSSISVSLPRLPKEKVSAPPRGPALIASGSTFCGGTMCPKVCVPRRPGGNARKSCCSRSAKGLDGGGKEGRLNTQGRGGRGSPRVGSAQGQLAHCIVPPASTTACASCSTLAK